MFKIDAVVTLSRNTFEATIDAQQTKYSNQLDHTMKVFSSLATMFLPLTLVSGMWGMNIAVPFMETDSLWPFWIMVIVMTVIIIAMSVTFRCLKWM